MNSTYQQIKVMILLIFFICPSFVEAKFNQKQKVILLDSAKEGENFGSLQHLIDNKEMAENIHLVGQARIINNHKSDPTIVQMVWTGIQSSEEKNKQVAFEKPMVSTFKVKNLSKTKGSALPIEGEPEILFKAIEQLKAGNIDKEDIRRKRMAKNPKKEGRFVEVENKKRGITKFYNTASKKLKNNLNKNQENNNIKPFSENPTSQFSQNPISHSKSVNNANHPVLSDTSLWQSSTLRQNTGNLETREMRNQAPELFERTSGSNPNLAGINDRIERSENDEQDARSDLALNVRDLEENQANQSAENDTAPTVTFETTEAGCQPRVDRVHERIIIQNRVRRLENNIVMDEGTCTDSMEIYPIMKDYLCENCADVVNIEEQRAYSRYQEYWYDRDNHRHNIDETLYTDTRRPYHFMDETGTCAPLVDLEANLAYRQVETVYFNFNNIRRIVQECHSSPNQAPIPIVQTTKRCGLIHDFENNVSYEQKRSIFTIDRIEHEAQQCHQVEPPLQHEFVEMGCRPIVDLMNGTVTKTARRRIRTSRGLKVITEDCEPRQNNNLNATREGCEGEYFHDFNLMRSYVKKRYYFARENTNREYVTGCVRTNEFLQQQTEHNGTYEHDDSARVSKPRLALYLDTEEQGRVFLDVARVRGQLGQVTYTLLRNEHRPTTNYSFEGCYRRTQTSSVNVYNRVDGSSYEQMIGAGNIIVSTTNECTKTYESRNAVIGRERGRWNRHGRDIDGKEVRIITVYPDGHKEPGPWQKMDYRGFANFERNFRPNF